MKSTSRSSVIKAPSSGLKTAAVFAVFTLSAGAFASGDPVADCLREIDAAESGRAQVDGIVTQSAKSPGFAGVRLEDLEKGKSRPYGSRKPDANFRAVSAASPVVLPDTGEGGELIPLKDETLSARPSDGGIVLAEKGVVHLVGFYGYGGFEKGEGYQFTGTGYTGAEGSSRVLPAALQLAGFMPDPRLDIYSAEMRAETPVPLGEGVDLVPFAGYRAVITQTSTSGDLVQLGGANPDSAENRSLQQIPVGIGLRLTHQSDAKTRYSLLSSVGAVANLSDSRGVPGALYGAPAENASVAGIGTFGIRVERGLWNFDFGADVGKNANESGTETGVSVNFRKKF